jgi:hypothetical protein
MTTKYCMRGWNHLVRSVSIISENQKFDNSKFGISEIGVIPGRCAASSPESMGPLERWDEWIPGPVLRTVPE